MHEKLDVIYAFMVIGFEWFARTSSYSFRFDKLNFPRTAGGTIANFWELYAKFIHERKSSHTRNYRSTFFISAKHSTTIIISGTSVLSNSKESR